MYDIEMGEIVGSEDMIHGILKCYYISGDTHTTMNPIVSRVHFTSDTLVVGHLKFKYEYILSFKKNENQLSIITLTVVDDNGGIIKSDTLSELKLFFEEPSLIDIFKTKFIRAIKKYKSKNVFDKSILKFRNFLKYMSKV